MSSADGIPESLGGYICENCLRGQYLREASGGPVEVDVEAMSARLEVTEEMEVAGGGSLTEDEKRRLKKGARLSAGPAKDPLLLEKEVMERLLKWGGEEFEGSLLRTRGYLLDEAHLEMFRQNEVKVIVTVDLKPAEGGLRLEAEQLYTLRKLNEVLGVDVKVELELTEDIVGAAEEVKVVVEELAESGINCGRVMLEPAPEMPLEAEGVREKELRETVARLARFFKRREKLKWEPFMRIRRLNLKAGEFPLVSIFRTIGEWVGGMIKQVGKGEQGERFLNVSPLALAAVKGERFGQTPDCLKRAKLSRLLTVKVLQNSPGEWSCRMPVYKGSDCCPAGTDGAENFKRKSLEVIRKFIINAEVGGELSKLCKKSKSEAEGTVKESKLSCARLGSVYKEKTKSSEYPVLNDFVEDLHDLRRMNVERRITPDFVCLGSARAGTTSLWHYLNKNPQICSPLIKEIEFFSKEHRLKKGAGWYRSFFPPVYQLRDHPTGNLQLTYEASPSYMFYPGAPELMQNHLPEVKLILLLRDPVKRAYSYYHHLRETAPVEDPDFKTDYQTLSFDEHITRELKWLPANLFELSWEQIYDPFRDRTRTLVTSLYYFQVKNWLRYFPREKMYFIKSEEFFDNTTEVMKELNEFLGVKFPVNQEYDRKYSTGSYPEMNDEMEKYLRDFFEPYNEKLYELVGKDFGWE